MRELKTSKGYAPQNKYFVWVWQPTEGRKRRPVRRYPVSSILQCIKSAGVGSPNCEIAFDQQWYQDAIKYLGKIRDTFVKEIDAFKKKVAERQRSLRTRKPKKYSVGSESDDGNTQPRKRPRKSASAKKTQAVERENRLLLKQNTLLKKQNEELLQKVAAASAQPMLTSVSRPTPLTGSGASLQGSSTVAFAQGMPTIAQNIYVLPGLPQGFLPIGQAQFPH